MLGRSSSDWGDTGRGLWLTGWCKSRAAVGGGQSLATLGTPVSQPRGGGNQGAREIARPGRIQWDITVDGEEPRGDHPDRLQGESRQDDHLGEGGVRRHGGDHHLHCILKVHSKGPKILGLTFSKFQLRKLIWFNKLQSYIQTINLLKLKTTMISKIFD